MLRPLFTSLLLATSAFAGDLLLVCGGDEVFQIDPDLKDRVEIKSADVHPVTGRLVVSQSSGKGWWTEEIEFLHPTSKLTSKGETLYMARWLNNSQ